jgi:ribosomal protein S18 acetylase RimI-like enzyme
MGGLRRLADPERDGTVFTRDLTDAAQVPMVPGVTLRPATAADAAALQEAMEASGIYSEDVVETRLRDGRRPYVVETDGKIVSYGWVAFSAEPIGDLGLSFELAAGEVYIYDCATRPDYRGRGYYPALLRAMVADLSREGWRRAWIGTGPGNFVSQRGIARAGFQKIADVYAAPDPNRSTRVELYGVPGVSPDLLRHAAWSFHGYAYPDVGISQQ